jgi:hypothetical protein
MKVKTHVVAGCTYTVTVEQGFLNEVPTNQSKDLHSHKEETRAKGSFLQSKRELPYSPLKGFIKSAI